MKVPQFNYRLEFGKTNSENTEFSPSESMNQKSKRSGQSTETKDFKAETGPLKESTRHNQPLNSEKKMNVANLKYQIENDIETTREVFATEETDDDVRLVMQKIEEARKHINALERESKAQFNEENENIGELTMDFQTQDENTLINEETS